MDSDTKTCKTCNHSCHCYGPECDNCSCDVCDCGSIKEYSAMEDIPDSFIKPNT